MALFFMVMLPKTIRTNGQSPAILPTSWAPSLFGSQCRLLTVR